jgi:hypothetical protein
MQSHFKDLRSKSFQWCKEFFNPMSFNPYNRPLKIREFNSQSGSSLGSMGVHSFTFSYTPRSMKCDSHASFLAHTSTIFCLIHEPKAKVATWWEFVETVMGMKTYKNRNQTKDITWEKKSQEM